MAGMANWALAMELGSRIDAIHARANRATTRELAADLDAVRALAAANGIAPALPVLHALEAALARGERGATIADALDLLGEAVRCGRNDARTSAIYAAACAVRRCG